jgi:putative ABC transport system ATP-binding protein
MNRFVTEGLRTAMGGPFSFSVAAGECLALSGPSGCGKTLLLRALADLDPAEGTVLLDGIDRNEMPAPDWRRQVGWLSAESAWWYEVVGDHVRDPRSEISSQNFPNSGKADAMSSSRPDSGKKRDEDIASALEKLGFEKDVLSWRIERLSTGEKQRLALFRLLLNKPKALLLDEPTAALDVPNVRKAEEMLDEYRRATGAAVLWISHDPEQIARVAGRHLRFAGGDLEAAS